MSAGTSGAPAAAGENIALRAHDGHALAGMRFRPAGVGIGAARASVVFGPAMAVSQTFYAAFAAHLAGQGFDVWTFDYRGTGASLKGSMRGVKADLTDWLKFDYDAVVQAAAAAGPGRPLYLVGHSLGGQFAPLLPSRDKVAGLINIAVGSGSLRHNVPSLRRKAPLMWYVMAPLLCPLFGYFPGSKIGVVGDLPTGAMFQWRKWCLTPDYILSGEPGAREAYASADYPVLSLFFHDDELLLQDGSRMLHEAYTRRPAGVKGDQRGDQRGDQINHQRDDQRGAQHSDQYIDQRAIAPADYGHKRIGHFGFFKPQCEATLWPLVTQWLDIQLDMRKAA